ncbi:hypothetical protein DM02DRAFT_719847 [Periconia macrospinosa]|uniref:Altered inheritance of mitochondria protein 9, mitochondrial n=1 Tax=Periconia macrospinosa TaxID=97972 RepID=A0A2V1DH90_9PLEO|nr:hypothetical protein DM02DRAFT_719847 [Periconia macrospinosa]
MMSMLGKIFRKRPIPASPISIVSPQHPRNISITCHRKPIGYEELYQYTNGRFLVDESFQLKRRQVMFDVSKLCDIAASAGKSSSPIVAIDKFEGGFSKALLMKKEDGTELIAKIPCPHAGLLHDTTASEVAVLQYVQDYTTIPVPKVFAWSSDPSNPVGCEYIIMEKAAGTHLFKIWDDMNESSHLELIKGLTKLECQLASLKFPASGHLYLRQSVKDKTKRKVFSSALDPSGSYCIGRSCDRAWLTETNAELATSESYQGPWTSVSAYGIALAKREISRISNTPRSTSCIPHYGTVREQVCLLETAISLLHEIEASDILKNLHMGNIYVSDMEPARISSIIDWQSISVSPLFLQAGWPIFLKPPKGYITGLRKPTLPDGFETLSSDDKEIATYQWKQATWSKAYEVSSYLNNTEAHNAMNAPRVFRELFLRCGSTWEEGVIPLRACLIEISQSWKTLDMPGDCPYIFENDEIKKHKTESKEYNMWQKVQEFAREYLGTDAEGWISPEENFEEKLEQNRTLFQVLVAQMTGQKSREELRDMWPFSNHLS